MEMTICLDCYRRKTAFKSRRLIWANIYAFSGLTFGGTVLEPF